MQTTQQTSRLLGYIAGQYNNARTETKLPPFKLAPVYKEYLWGGTKLKTQFGKQTNMPIVAESWELSVHPDGTCVIASGKLAGTPFSVFIHKHPELCGTNYNGKQEFPILIKLIDAQRSLSIQVHPNDEYAQLHEHELGKTEMWIVLESEPDAFIYYGFEREITKQEMRRYIENNTITDVLHKQPVKPGDIIFIPAGTIHAIGAGIVLAEVQQNSNSTYRVYDFGRLGADGKPRELHLDKALDVTQTKPAPQNVPGKALLELTVEYALEQLALCAEFSVQRLSLEGRYLCKLNGQSFVSVLCVEGAAMLESETDTLYLQKGDCVFVPANQKGFFMKGAGKFIFTRLGE